MHIEFRSRPNRLLLTGSALLLLAWLISATASIGATTLPADVLRLDLDRVIEQESASVSERAAVAAAASAAPNIPATADVHAYLLLTTENTSVAASPGRLVWLVRYSGLTLYFPGPLGEDGAETKGHTAAYAYVLVDAVTGEAFDIQYWE